VFSVNFLTVLVFFFFISLVLIANDQDIAGSYIFVTSESLRGTCSEMRKINSVFETLISIGL
jgi:hypothetical protein